MDDINGLCDRIREVAFALHIYLGPGHLESVYENGLAHRLKKRGLGVESQARLAVYDEDGQLIGSYVADLLVEKHVIVELKAVSRLNAEHAAQILGYLKASRLRHGLLVNFGAAVFAIRKFKI